MNTHANITNTSRIIISNNVYTQSLLFVSSVSDAGSPHD